MSDDRKRVYRLRRIRLRIVDLIGDLRTGQLWLGPVVICTQKSYFRAINGVVRDELRDVCEMLNQRRGEFVE